MDYKGYVELNLDDEKLAHFYNSKEAWAELAMIKEN